MDMIKSTAESYDAVCDNWDKIRSSRPIDNCIKEFAKLIVQGGSILDVGCGTGSPVDVYLSNVGFSVTGIDVSSKMIERAKSLSLKNVVFENADILTYKTVERFDALIAFDSVWHVRHDAQESLYGIFANLLRPNGYLLFTHGLSDGEQTGEMFGEQFYYSSLDKSQAEMLLRQNGFEIISSIEKYEEPTSGTRDWLVIAKKQAATTE